MLVVSLALCGIVPENDTSLINHRLTITSFARRYQCPAEGELVIAIASLKADLLQGSTNNPQQTNADIVPEREVEQLAETLGVIYLPTSAKTNHNVQALFQRVADQVLQNRKNAKLLNESGVVDPAGNGMHNQQHGVLEMVDNDIADERANNAASPRRSKYDKYYVQEKMNDKDNKSANSSRSKHSRESTPRNIRGNNNVLREEGNAELPKSERKKTRSSSKLKEGLCADDSYYSCQPVACGAVDMEGGSYCVIQ